MDTSTSTGEQDLIVTLAAESLPPPPIPAALAPQLERKDEWF